MNKKELHDNEVYYICMEDILISFQWMLFMSLLEFMKVTHKNIKIIETEDLNDKSNKIEIFDECKDEYLRLLKEHFRGESNEILDIRDRGDKLMERILVELDIEEPSNFTRNYLTRDKEEILNIKDLIDVFHSLPINMKTITSKFYDKFITTLGVFEDSHKIVYEHDIIKKLFGLVIEGDTRYNLDDFPLDIITVGDMYNEISEMTDGVKLPFVVTSRNEVIENVVDLVKKMVEHGESENEQSIIVRTSITVPRNAKYLNIDVIPEVMQSMCDIW